MQDTKAKGLKTDIRRRGRDCQVRWVPCVDVGKKNRGQGGSGGLLEALHAGKGTGTGKKNAVGLRGG